MCIFTGNSDLIFFFERTIRTVAKLRSFSIRYFLDSEHPNVTQMWQLLIDYALCAALIVKQCWSVGYASLLTLSSILFKCMHMIIFPILWQILKEEQNVIVQCSIMGQSARDVPVRMVGNVTQAKQLCLAGWCQETLSFRYGEKQKYCWIYM